MTKRKTHEYFVEQVKQLNLEIEIIGEYKNNKTKIWCKCLRCGHEWGAWPTALLKRHGCRPCSSRGNAMNRIKTNEQFLLELEEKNPGVVPLEPYVKFNTPIKCICVCGNSDWKVSPANLYEGKLCKECAGERSSQTQRDAIEKGRVVKGRERKTQELFEKEVNQSNPDIEITGEYTGADNRIACRCRRCGRAWNPIAQSLVKGTGCSNCKKKWQTSFPEQAIFYYVRKKYPEAINTYKKGFGRSELDVYIPEINVAIEYDGRRWHKDKFESEMKKYAICRTLNIKLIRVSERPVERNELICDHFIYTKFGNTKKNNDLDESIKKLFDLFSIDVSVNTQKDMIAIRDQYYNSIEEKSLGRLFPGLVSEWHQPSNGTITPFMMKPKSNVEFYWKCPDCGDVYHAPPANRTNGTGCKKCAGILPITQDEFEKRVHTSHPTIKVIGKYINCETKVKCECMECGHIWYPTPTAVTKGVGCKKCWDRAMAEQKRKPEAVFLEQVHKMLPNVTVLGKYTNGKDPILCRCEICKHTWSPIAQSLVSGYGCGNCSQTKKKRVVCVETGEEYESIHQAGIKTGIAHSTISNCCNGKGNTAGGYHWKFVKE